MGTKHYNISTTIMFIWLGTLGLAGLALFGCRLTTSSETKGHISLEEAKNSKKFVGNYAVVPEYKESSGLILSEIFDLYLKDPGHFFQSLGESGIDTLYLSQSEGSDLAAKVLNKYRKILKDKKANLKVVPITIPSPKKSDAHSVWVRDFGPITVASKEGLGAIADFNYHGVVDKVLDERFNSAFAKTVHVPTFKIPLYFEGGNLLAVEKDQSLFCFTTTRLNEMMRVKNDVIKDKESLIKYLKVFLGCQQVHRLPEMPYEPTGHIDMWAKALGPKKILISQLSPAMIGLSDDCGKAAQVAVFLDARAVEFAKLGFEVERVPMPAPLFKYEMFRNYTNSLQLNNHLFSPRYIKPDSGLSPALALYPDDAHLKSLEDQVTKILMKHNLQVHWVDSDSLIAMDGSIHCATMQIPRLKNMP